MESLASDLKKLPLSIESRVVALTLVKFAPLIAGSVAGNLASGNVPEFKFDAEPAVKLPAEPVVFWLSVGTLAAAIVPEAMFDAFNEVRFTPLIAGSVAGKRASGTVPDPKFDAFNAVKVEPSPINVLPLAT